MVKILVVDDEVEICNVLNEFLTEKNYKVSTAYDGEEALTKIKEEKPHVILLDIRMGKMDGMEVLKRVKEIDENIGVIMMTAVNDLEIIKESINMGIDEYIIKPIKFAHLEELLNHWRQL